MSATLYWCVAVSPVRLIDVPETDLLSYPVIGPFVSLIVSRYEVAFVTAFHERVAVVERTFVAASPVGVASVTLVVALTDVQYAEST